jgi:16S rRNA (cytosine1402-N4)-methyltransferase
MKNNLDFHKPVMLEEVLKALDIKDDESYLDCTFGAGGYSKAILKSANCKLYAIDRDESVREFADILNKEFNNNFIFSLGKFSESKKILNQQGVEKLDGIVLDIGVSSMQLDDKSRGFSFDSNSKLDMRMDKRNPYSAYELVNELSQEELTDIIKTYGEEPKAKKIAQKIIAQRAIAPITSCMDLANIVRSLYKGYFKTDPATRTFQALRIFINQELEELKEILNSSIDLLKPGGRLVVVSFHSLEDSIVKKFLKTQAGIAETFSRYMPDMSNVKPQETFRLITKSAISPSDEEIENNPRARSAKMRVAIKI